MQITGRESISWIELQSTLMTYESRLEQLNATRLSMAGMEISRITAAFANKINSNSRNNSSTEWHNKSHRGGAQGRGNFRNGNIRGRTRGGRSSNSKLMCQICGKPGHTAPYCWNRYDEDFMGASPNTGKGKQDGSSTAFTAAVGSEADQSWFMDSGASNHVTNDENQLSSAGKYAGKKTLMVGNGSKLSIAHTGKIYFPSLSHKVLQLKNVLHVPYIKKNLVSVSQLAFDNNVLA